jgi:hypothetical protein
MLVASAGINMSSPFDAKRTFLLAPFRTYIIVLCRDSGSGSVTEDAHGNLQVDYTINDDDMSTMIKGVETAARILVAAGAVEV